MKRLAIVYNKGISDYDFGQGHPFRGDRFPNYMKLLGSRGVLQLPGVVITESSEATDEDLRLVHAQDYIDDVKRRAERRVPLSVDTPLSTSIVGAARLIVGASLKAGELVADGKADVAQGVGGGLHHAGRDYGKGFCVFNDVAVCAHALLSRRGLKRILVFDTDAHAGNGTMDIFYEEPRVLFISVHQDPRTIFPGTGFIEQIGDGPGRGYTVNIPLPPGADDECMSLVLDKVFKPLARAFKPQVIIRNGGTDPHFQDGLSNLGLTLQGLFSIGRAVADAATEAGCGIVDLSCSGYNPDTVAPGWLALLSGEVGIDFDSDEKRTWNRSPRLIGATRSTIEKLAGALCAYWRLG